MATLTTVTSSRNPAAVGAAVTFRIRVRTAPAGAGIPVGTVILYVDGIAVGAPITLNATGRATVSTNWLAIGRHTVSVVYAGSGVFAPRTSGNLHQRIR